MFSSLLHRSLPFSFSRYSGLLISAALFAAPLAPTHGQETATPETPDMSWMKGLAGASGEEALPTLVPIPPLPPGAETTFTPIQDVGGFSFDPEQARQEANQRADALLADLRTVGSIQDLPATGSAEFAKLRADALAIVQRRFQESRGALESDATDAFKSAVTWTPDFSAAPRTIAAADQTRARAASYSVAFAITCVNRPRYIVAYASAVFALAPDSALGAENAASAILTSGERLYPDRNNTTKLQPFRDDAALVYRYALACSVVKDKWTTRSLSILINLGNLYVDLKKPERARPLLFGAVQYSPSSWEAAVALAGCYEMQGRSDLSRAVLENARLSPSSIYASSAKGAKNLADTMEASELSPESSDEEFDGVMKKFDQQEILTAADFAGGFDQSTRNRLRYFIDNLPVKGSYRAPEIDLVTQFSTIQAINKPSGINALGEFSEKLGSYSLVLLGRMMQQQEDFLKRLGLGVQLNVDMQDVLAHPEKYRNTEVKGTVTGAEQLKSRVAQMKAQAEQAGRELATGKVTTLLQMGAASDPMIAIFQLKAVHFANPMDVMVQQYNASTLGRKMNAYNAYFFSVNNRTREGLTDVYRLYGQKVAGIHEQEAAAMRIYEEQAAAAARSGANINSPEWRLRRHNIHKTFAPQYNQAADFAWKQATQTAAIAYERKVAARAERFYYDVFRHIALISDPAVREKKSREFAQMLHNGVYQGLLNVLSAFGSYNYVEDWDCHCDVGDLLAQAEQERTELDRLAEESRARENAAKLRFTRGELPESSQLFQKLDAYGTDLDIPFIPALSGRISCARETVSFEAELPVPASPKANFTFTKNALTGATTHGGGLEVSGEVGEDGAPKIGVTLNIKGSISMDGKGEVSDYSVSSATDVKVEMGPASVHAGAEIGYTKSGGMTSDVGAGATISLSEKYGGSSGEVSLETSAQRGSTFSAKAEYNYRPYSQKYDEFANEALKENNEKLFGDSAVDTSDKKEIWSGSYTF